MKNLRQKNWIFQNYNLQNVGLILINIFSLFLLQIHLFSLVQFTEYIFIYLKNKQQPQFSYKPTHYYCIHNKFNSQTRIEYKFSSNKNKLFKNIPLKSVTIRIITNDKPAHTIKR